MIMILLFTGGLILRLYGLGKHSLWFDEAYSIFNGQYLLSVISSFGVLPDRYPSFLSDIPVYLWSNCFGRDDFTLRLFSVVWGICAIPLVYKLGYMFFDRKTGFIAAFLLAFSPIHIYYSQELRGYSLIVLLGLISVLFLMKAIQRGSVRFWLGYAVSNVLNIYIHYMTVFFLLAQAVFFLIFIKEHKDKARKWLFFNVFISILLIPWLINSIYLLKIALGTDSYLWIPSWTERIGALNLFYTVKNFSIGYTVNRYIYTPITAVFIATLIFGIMNVKKKDIKMSALCLCCFFLPILSMFLISRLKVWYVDRYVLSSLPFYYILVAYGLSRIKARYVFIWLAVLIFYYAIALGNYYRGLPIDAESCIGVVNKYDYRPASAYLTESLESNDIIFHTSHSSVVPLMHYSKQKGSGSVFDKANHVVLYFAEDENKVKGKEFLLKGCKFREVDYEDIISGKGRFWLVHSDWYFDMDYYADTESYRTVRWMKRHYKEKEKKQFNGVILYLFEIS